MKKFLKALVSIINATMKIFAPHEVLNIIIDKYINEVIPEYYMNLFNRFYIEFKSASF